MPVGPMSRTLDFSSSTSFSHLVPEGDALVVVVDGDGEHLLRLLLADHVLVEVVLDLRGLGNVFGELEGEDFLLFVQDLLADLDALVADVDARARDQPPGDRPRSSRRKSRP